MGDGHRTVRVRKGVRLGMGVLWIWWLISGLLWGCQRQPVEEAASPVVDATPTLISLPPTWTPSPSATPSLTPTVTPTPTPTATPTPRPTPTLPPQGVGATDALQDGIYCHTGRPALFLLPSTVDLFHASMERVTVEGTCYYRVRILFDGSADEGPIRGGVEFYNPNVPLMDPPSRTWYFDNVAHISFNFRRDDPQGSLRLWVDTLRGRRWVEIRVPDYQGRVENGVLVLDIPCEAVAQASFWMVASTNPELNKCDVLGVQEDRASLPLP